VLGPVGLEAEPGPFLWPGIDWLLSPNLSGDQVGGADTGWSGGKRNNNYGDHDDKDCCSSYGRHRRSLARGPFLDTLQDRAGGKVGRGGIMGSVCRRGSARGKGSAGSPRRRNMSR
jgi:hypothetical protein